MRQCVIGLAAVALLVLAGCGNDDDSDDNADNGDGGSTQEFCHGFNEFDQQFAGTDPDDPEAMDDAVDALRALDPPDDIRDDYQTLLNGLEAYSEVDPTDQAAVSAVQEEYADSDDAIDNIDAFVTEECGVASG